MSYDMVATGDRWWSEASQAVREDYGQECFYIKFKQKGKTQNNIRYIGIQIDGS
jgi:hypothetical protein